MTTVANGTHVPRSFYEPEDGTGSCVVCKRPAYETYREVSHFGFPFRFSRCRRCGLIKQTPMPNEAFFEWFFNSDLFLSAKESEAEHIWGFYDYLKDEPCRLATSKYRYRRLGGVFATGQTLRIMKIGPSTGSMLHVAKEHGHDVVGCDVNTTFVDYARDVYDVHIDHGRFERLGYAEASFDVILLFNVIENVPNLNEFLGAVHRTLRRDGVFVLNYVNMRRNLLEKIQGSRYFIYRPPICHVFAAPVLARLLDNYGFAVESSYRDIRILHLEKVLALLRWKRLLRVASAARAHLVRFPIYAYPSRLVVARKA